MWFSKGKNNEARTVCLFLIKITGKLYSPAYYLMSSSGLVFLICLYLIIKQCSGSMNSDEHFGINLKKNTLKLNFDSQIKT